ncbi:MAG: hypothetical protein AAGA29_01525 [Planctomycetota bacterium]
MTDDAPRFRKIASAVLTELNLAANPLVVRGVRTRLRPQALVSSALVTITVSAFLYILVYTSAKGNVPLPDDTTPEDLEVIARNAARSAIVPLIIVQGIILMVLGTGAAAGGVARERSDRLLDYHRVTPMPPHAKIVGLLFGLPIREYFMFALTLPFVAYAAVRGGVPLMPLVQFYIVFFSSVWLYHLTGMVSGMIVERPWRAGFVVQAMVLGLYFGLPRLSTVMGLTTFEFLTVRPAFFGIVQEHLLADWGQVRSFQEGWENAQADLRYRRWRDVAFFNLQLHPLAFSLMVQGFVLFVLFSVIYRRWQGEARLLISKPLGMLYFVVIQFFVLGTLLGILWDVKTFEGMLGDRQDINSLFPIGAEWLVWRFLFGALAISGIGGTLLLHLVTPTWHQQVNALRRARKRGRRHLPLLADAASPWPVALGVVVVSAASFMLLVHRIDATGYLDNGGPYLGMAGVGTLFLSVVLLGVFLLREQVAAKTFIMCLFVFWIVPFMAWVILFFGLGREVMGVFVGLPCPVTALYLLSVLMVYDPGGEQVQLVMMPEEIAPYASVMGGVALSGYAAVLVGLGVAWWMRRRRLLAAVEVRADAVTADLSAPRP